MLNNRWFRHDWDAIQRLKDGLTIDAQGLPMLTTAIAKLLPATSRTYNDDFWVKRTRDPQTKTAAACGIVAVPDPSDDVHRLNGGRLLERIQLWTAAQRDYAALFDDFTPRSASILSVRFEPPAKRRTGRRAT